MTMSNIFRWPQNDGPHVERVRHEPKILSLRVDAVERLTPLMLRITLAGEELADFRSLGFDDHVKLLVPTASGVQRRDYTPRRFDPASRTLVIDFAIHENGPAARWALGAQPGDEIQIAGPKGSSFLSPDVRKWLLVGDETALPAIGRRIQEAPAGARITSAAAVAGPEEEQRFTSNAEFTSFWVHRPLSEAADPSSLLRLLPSVALGPETFVWIAAEARVARAVRDYLVDERHHPRNWIKAGGYWIKGRADAHERIG